MLNNNQNIEQALEQMKIEIATEMGIEINSDMQSRDAGKIGGTITKRLIALGEQKLMEMASEQPKINPNMINKTKPQQNQIH